jgi:hypothetical protein
MKNMLNKKSQVQSVNGPVEECSNALRKRRKIEQCMASKTRAAPHFAQLDWSSGLQCQSGFR